MRVVVAAHQRDRERLLRVAPAEEGGVERRDPPRGRVQEIAEHHEPGRARALDQRREPREVVRRRAPGNGNAAGAKRRGLAEMHVGDKQRPCTRPEERALGEQIDPLAAERDDRGARAHRQLVRQPSARPRRRGRAIPRKIVP